MPVLCRSKKKCKDFFCTKTHTEKNRKLCKDQDRGKKECKECASNDIHINTTEPFIFVPIIKHEGQRVISKSCFQWINRALNKPEYKFVVKQTPSKESFVFLFEVPQNGIFDESDYAHFDIPNNESFEYKSIQKNIKTAKIIRKRMNVWITKENLQDCVFVSEEVAKGPQLSIIFVIWKKNIQNEVKMKIDKHLAYERPKSQNFDEITFNLDNQDENQIHFEYFKQYVTTLKAENEEKLKKNEINTISCKKLIFNNNNIRQINKQNIVKVFDKNEGRFQNCCKKILEGKDAFPFYQVVSRKNNSSVWLIGPDSYDGFRFKMWENKLTQLEKLSAIIELKNSALYKIKKKQIDNKFKQNSILKIGKKTNGNQPRRSHLPGRSQLVKLWNLSDAVLPKITILEDGSYRLTLESFTLPNNRDPKFDWFKEAKDKIETACNDIKTVKTTQEKIIPISEKSYEYFNNTPFKFQSFRVYRENFCYKSDKNEDNGGNINYFLKFYYTPSDDPNVISADEKICFYEFWHCVANKVSRGAEANSKEDQ